MADSIEALMGRSYLAGREARDLRDQVASLERDQADPHFGARVEPRLAYKRAALARADAEDKRLRAEVERHVRRHHLAVRAEVLRDFVLSRERDIERDPALAPPREERKELARIEKELERR